MYYKLRVLLLLVAAVLLTSNVNAQQTEYAEEIRGVWITNVASPMMYNKDSIAEAMDYLASNGINVVFPVVWNKAETQYPSQIMLDQYGVLIEDVFQIQGRDPLAELITEAHRNGMEVIPWFEYGFAASFGDQTGGRLIQQNPHWATRNSAGQFFSKNGFYWANGLHPEVQELMLSLIHEVIDNYDIDGVQGDDRLPAMPSEAGYDDFTVELYRSEHGGNNPPAGYLNNDWMLWRADKLTNFLGRLYRGVKEKDENLIVSMSPSHYNFSLREYLQDVPRWLDSNYVDMIHPQLYRGTADAYLTELKGVVGPNPGSVGGYVKPQDRHKLAPGILTRSGNTVYGPQVISQMISHNREYGINGEVFFFYEGMGAANDYLADSLGATFYSEPAILPFRQGQLRRPPATIMNETDSGVDRVGSWQAVIPSPSPPGYEGRSLRGQAGSGASLTYNIDVPYDAWYRVYAYTPYDSNTNPNNATTGAPYTVYHNAGEDSVVTKVNQSLFRNRGWVPIANVYLEAGVKPVVRIKTDEITDGKPVFADAVMLILDRSKSPDVDIPVQTSIYDHIPEIERPRVTSLMPAYPNPFNPTTNIRYRLESTTQVNMEVYDLLGRRVATLVDQVMPAGEHQVLFDGANLASGMYLYRLQAGGEVFTNKMMLIK
ncbi:MAG: family 10 glycosylhydrolase [Balneolales bacterium]|nr:family 10 glycosylhydrolase [Balneolales bacterium]